MSKKITTKEFVERANVVHSNKYNYDLVEYKRTHDPITITCPWHGNFTQLPSNHLRGHGCKVCAGLVISEKLSTSQEDFIAQCRKIHGDRYSYQLVKYRGSGVKVKIICAEHGEFQQTPEAHLYGQGCALCAHRIRGINRRSQNTDFINKANLIHKWKYNYSTVDYKTSAVKVEIICSTHGPFMQTPNGHLSGKGCPICALDRPSTSRDDFIARALIIHNNKYNYDNVEFNTLQDKVRIKCPYHGEFLQRATKHLNGSGCRKCHDDRCKVGTSDFIKRAINIHGNVYDYSLVNYDRTDHKVKIICKEHGVFEQNPNSHLQGKGCPFCAVTGFNSGKDGFIYVLESDSFIKVGITNKKVSIRASRINITSPEKFTVMFSSQMRGSHVLQIETQLLRWLRGEYDQPSVVFDGHTECFYKGVLQTKDVVVRLLNIKKELEQCLI